MVIFETPTFTRQVDTLFDEESYRRFQLELVAYPDRGAIIRGSGGLRKLRWHGGGVGKRGGLRVIYYWAGHEEMILLLLAYRKTDKDDLSAEQVRILGRVVKEEFG